MGVHTSAGHSHVVNVCGHWHCGVSAEYTGSVDGGGHCTVFWCALVQVARMGAKLVCTQPGHIHRLSVQFPLAQYVDGGGGGHNMVL
jgi:hypothetical protein